MLTGVLISIIFAVVVALVMSIIYCIRSWRRPSQVDSYDSHPPSDHVVSIPPPIAQILSGLPSHVAPPSSSPHAPFPGKLCTPPSPDIALSSGKSTITYKELAKATNGFSKANIIGQGGFGFVYKGILPNGTEVAVKKLKPGSGQGEREYQAEVELISCVNHNNLVLLVGYCSTGSERLLAYEFVPNKTLEFHLHGEEQPTMKWSTRLKIALGSAKGLAYLHEHCHPKIIHRDIKAANILLDSKFEVKVADFGLAKTTSDLNTHVSTRVMGTRGYLAPEYASSGKLTDKADVYSYGVMLLELISGRRPAERALKEKNIGNLVDPRLKNIFDPKKMTCMVDCVAACTRNSAMLRPKMSQVHNIRGFHAQKRRNSAKNYQVLKIQLQGDGRHTQ